MGQDKKMTMFLMGVTYKRSPEAIIKGVCMWDCMFASLGLFYGIFVSMHVNFYSENFGIYRL